MTSRVYLHDLLCDCCWLRLAYCLHHSEELGVLASRTLVAILPKVDSGLYDFSRLAGSGQHAGLPAIGNVI